MAKSKMQRLKSCRPSPGHLEINRWIREQEARLGIDTSAIGGSAPTVTTIYVPVPVATRTELERLHALADAKISDDHVYAEQCDRLDRELAEISKGCESVSYPLPRSKSNRQNAGSGPRVLMND